ncbi:MAG: DDE-type integrase/transposase/recombinase [Actinomycetota bacterium]
MSKHRVVVLKIVAKQLTVSEATAEYGISRRLLHRLLARYRQEGLHFPSTSTIRRILHTAGMITPEPRKRPRSSYLRFEAARPNETWQSDFTHWRLADGTDIEILNWLDDHSRYLLSTTNHPVTGDDVVTTFPTTTDQHGIPASTLTDNGRVYTARFGGGRNAFEYPLPHRSNNRATPRTAYRATPKASPAAPREGFFRLRYDHVTNDGKTTLRHAGQLHHLGIGIEHRGKRILALIDENTTTVIHLDTGEIIATNTINPARNYWRNNMEEPGRWPGSS